MSPQELHSLTAFIFDLDGVIWRGHTPIPGAVESVLRLRAAGKRCFYATNNSRLTQPQFAERLRAIGLELADEEVMTSSAATAFYLQSQFANAFSCYVIGEEGIQTALGSIGGRVLSQCEAESTLDVDCVVVGIDRFFTYDKLRLAQKFILRGARFFATNSDWTFPTEDGVVPGAGSLVAAVQAASSQQPLIIGKPQPTMLRLCVERFGLDAQTTAMVGDRLDTDIACGHRAELKSLMVCTGVHTREQGIAAQGDEIPDAIFEDLTELCQAILATDERR
jgi:4-nitrophenyl phosphatase